MQRNMMIFNESNLFSLFSFTEAEERCSIRRMARMKMKFLIRSKSVFRQVLITLIKSHLAVPA